MKSVASGVPTARNAPSDESAVGSASGRRARRIESFHPLWRRYIAGLTACSPELEDLAETFPAVLFALVSDYADAPRREAAFALADEGAPLREIADVLGLPWWLRRLPASAFQASIPEFPADGEFAQRIGNLLPRDTRDNAFWLASVGTAAATAGADYALWIARQLRPTHLSEDTALLMGAWAWFSQHPGILGHRLLRKPWRNDMSIRRACEELTVWRRRLRLVDALGGGLQDSWLADGEAGGLQFVALRTVEDFLAESEAMENCLDQYADQLRSRGTVIFSVRRGSRRIACLEIGMHDEECTMPSIVQLRAARNRRASPDVWQATFAWLGGQQLIPRKPRPASAGPQRGELARFQLWQPYLDHVVGSPIEASLRRIAMLPVRNSPRARRVERLSPVAEVAPPSATGMSVPRETLALAAIAEGS